MGIISFSGLSISGKIRVRKDLNDNLFQSLTSLGLTTNLKLCLDAGASASYSGSGQDWIDLSGFGNSDEFHMGSTTGVDATDPTFSGTAGGITDQSFESVGGGEFFLYGSANEAWMETMHKQNALWSFGAFIFLDTGFKSSPSVGLFGTSAGNSFSNETGIQLFIDNNAGRKGSLTIRFENNANKFDSEASASIAVENAWNYYGASIDEAGGNVSFMRIGTAYDQRTGSVDTFDAGFGFSPGNASHPMELGARGNASQPMTDGMKIGSMFLIQGTALTPANHDDIYNAQKARYGL